MCNVLSYFKYAILYKFVQIILQLFSFYCYFQIYKLQNKKEYIYNFVKICFQAIPAHRVLSTYLLRLRGKKKNGTYRWSLQFYAPTVTAQQVLVIGVKQFSAQKITRYSFVLWHNGAAFSGVRWATVAFVTVVFINHHNFTGVGYSTVLVTYSPHRHAKAHQPFVANG